MFHLLGPPSERQPGDLKRATDIVLSGGGQADLLAPYGRGVRRRCLCHGARARDTRMSTATLKREVALLRSSLAALTPTQSATLDDPIAWAERIAELTLDPWQRDVLLFAAPSAPRCHATVGQEHSGGAQGGLDGAAGWPCRRVSPSLRQSGFLFRKLAAHLVASGAGFRRETMTEVEVVAGGLAVSLPGDRPAMLRGLSLRHDGPAVLIVDEASQVRDELWATISPMLAAAPAAQQFLLSTPAGASGEFHRAWSSGEDWERVQITADQCPREPSAAQTVSRSGSTSRSTSALWSLRRARSRPASSMLIQPQAIGSLASAGRNP